MITHVNIHGHKVQVSKRKPSAKRLVRNGEYTSTSGFAKNTFSVVVEMQIRLQREKGCWWWDCRGLMS